MIKEIGYDVVLFQSVYHDGKFSHNAQRTVRIKLPAAVDPKDYVLKFVAKPDNIYKAGGLVVSVGHEYIYRLVKLGVARYVVDIEYVPEDGESYEKVIYKAP